MQEGSVNAELEGGHKGHEQHSDDERDVMRSVREASASIQLADLHAGVRQLSEELERDSPAVSRDDATLLTEAATYKARDG